MIAPIIVSLLLAFAIAIVGLVVPKQTGKQVTNGLIAGLKDALAESVSVATKEAIADVPKALLGGGSTPVAVAPYGPLSWLPRWNQKAGTLPDGKPDPERYNDCGEECCAMVVASVHGVCLEAGMVRQMLGGPERSGLTNGSDMVAALKRCNVLAIAHDNDVSIAWQTVQAGLKSAYPAMVLGQWQPPDALHWVLVSGVYLGGVSITNPWDGVVYPISWETFVKLYRGAVVEVQAHCHYDMSSVQTPGT